MKFKFVVGFISLACVLVGCAGPDADLEKARHLLGREGDTSAATEALSLVTPLLTSERGPNRVEAYRLYAGAKMTLAGFNGGRIISAAVYKTSDNTAAILKSAVSDEADAATLLADAYTKLNECIATSDFTDLADLQAKNGIQYQIGLVKFFQALRVTLVDSGFITAANGDAALAACSTNVPEESVVTVETDLGLSKSAFLTSGMTSDNSLIVFVSKVQEPIALASGATAKKTAFCQYLKDQAGLTQ